MGVKVQFSALKQTKWYEYLIRFVFGGLVTASTGLIANKYGPVVGGLFLAFPSIFPASVTLVQKHKKQKEEEQGRTEEDSKIIARKSAGKTAQGAAAGSWGLLAFGIVIWQLAGAMPPWLVLLLALVLWFGVGVLAWWIYTKVTHQDEEAEENQ